METIPKENLQKFPPNFQDFENIQVPTPHLEAENPSGLVSPVHLNLDLGSTLMQFYDSRPPVL